MLLNRTREEKMIAIRYEQENGTGGWEEKTISADTEVEALHLLVWRTASKSIAIRILGMSSR
jgi:hypothetical protein